MRAKTRHWEAHWAALGRPFRKGGGEGQQVALDEVISHARSSRDQNSVNLEFYDVFQRSLDTCSVSGTSVILMLTSRVFCFCFCFFCHISILSVLPVAVFLKWVNSFYFQE